MAPLFTGLRLGFGRSAEDAGAAPGFFAITGGSTTLTPGDGKKYHIFTGPGSLTVSPGFGSNGIIDMFIVAGGGGGGSAHPSTYEGPGGGGGGGIVYATSYQIYGDPTNPTNYPVTVGSGGTGGSGGYGQFGGTGGPSSINLTLPGAPGTAAIPIQAMGGGGGATWYAPPYVGGSGGNGGGGVNNFTGGPLQAPPNSPVFPLCPGTVTVYGNAGHQTTGVYGSGGGGSGARNLPSGVGEAPSADVTNGGGDGGDGQAFPAYPGTLIAPTTPNPAVFGPVVGPTGIYAGGGGGACYRNNYAPDGDGGPGGGGYGGTGRSASGPPLGVTGVPATGGGGGGGSGLPSVTSGGNGGPGIVIVS